MDNDTKDTNDIEIPESDVVRRLGGPSNHGHALLSPEEKSKLIHSASVKFADEWRKMQAEAAISSNNDVS